jgi:hypothetical protein
VAFILSVKLLTRLISMTSRFDHFQQHDEIDASKCSILLTTQSIYIFIYYSTYFDILVFAVSRPLDSKLSTALLVDDGMIVNF